jgi:ABC-2 type transport system permease protein
VSNSIQHRASNCFKLAFEYEKRTESSGAQTSACGVGSHAGKVAGGRWADLLIGAIGLPRFARFVRGQERILPTRLGPVLHRDRPRRALAGRGMGCHVVQGSHHRRDRSHLLRKCMARHEKDAGEGLNMRKRLNSLFSYRLRALLKKEFNETSHDRKLMFSMTVMPVVQLTLIGFALSAAVSNVPLAIVDDSRSPESRELVATLTESKSFWLAGYYSSVDQLGEAASRGKADAGMVVPYDYARNLARDRQTTIQFLLNATNANTATISRGYAESVIQRFNTALRNQGIHVRVQPNAGSDFARRGQVQLQPAFLYNPGLVDSWFIVTGVLGLLLILDSSLICSAAMVREREAGTLEQLLMSPASSSEIIIAKITPLFLLLFLMMLAAIGVLKFAFGVPFRGNIFLLLAGGALCILSQFGREVARRAILRRRGLSWPSGKPNSKTPGARWKAMCGTPTSIFGRQPVR